MNVECVSVRRGCNWLTLNEFHKCPGNYGSPIFGIILMASLNQWPCVCGICVSYTPHINICPTTPHFERPRIHKNNRHKWNRRSPVVAIAAYLTLIDFHFLFWARNPHGWRLLQWQLAMKMSWSNVADALVALGLQLIEMMHLQMKENKKFSKIKSFLHINCFDFTNHFRTFYSKLGERMVD